MITLDELERIKNQVSKSNVEPYITMRNEDRQQLHDKSKGRIKNWSNTLDATRIKREEDRIKRLEDEEVRFFKFCYDSQLLCCRSPDVKSMQRSRSSKMSYAANKLKKLTVSCMTLKTWLSPWRARCCCLMSWRSKTPKKSTRLARTRSNATSNKTGKSLKSKRWRSTTKRCAPSSNGNTTRRWKTPKQLVTSLKSLKSTTSSNSRKTCLKAS